MTNVKNRRSSALAALLVLAMVAIQLTGPLSQPASAVVPVGAPSCASANVGVEALQATTPGVGTQNVFYIDAGASPKLTGQYAGYRITNNTGGALSDLWVKVDSFTGTQVTLAAGEDGISQGGALASGASDVEYFYLRAGAAAISAQTHAIHVCSTASRVWPARPRSARPPSPTSKWPT